MKATVKRLVAMLLVIAMVMTLLPTFVFADDTVTATKVETLADGDQIVWRNVYSGKVLDKQGSKGYYQAGVDATIDEDGVMTVPSTSVVWTIEWIDGTDTFYMVQDGKYLASQNSYTSTVSKTTPDTYCVWKYTENKELYNAAGKYPYLQWSTQYSNFSMFHNGGSEVYYFDAYKVGGDTTGDEPLKVEIVQESSNTSTFGHLDLSISTEDLLKTFEYGDIVTVSFAGQSYDFPICTDYGDVDVYAYLIRAKAGKSTVTMAINMGQIGVTSGLLEAITTEEGSVRYQFKEEVEFPLYATITLKEAGGYKDEMEIRKLDRVNDRDAYPELTDEQFANFRKVTTTGMGNGALYRSSSPINPELGRNTYADAAAKKAGVKTFINLADTESEATAYEGYADSYYSKQNHIFLGLPVAFGTDTFKNGLAKGFRYMVEHEGPYLVHCTEGKDRAGLTAAILECLMGATAEEVSADYLTTYRNYYNVVDGVQTALTDEQVAYLKQAILDNLCGIFDVEDATTADLAAEAAAYMKEIGLTDAEIEQLKTNLGKTYTDESEAGYTYILHSNDVHGSIEGYAYIAAMKTELEAKGAEVILADGGDYSQGTTYVSVSKGATAVELMNAAGYDVATLGNHEFDYGYAQLKENMEKADFTVLCSDVLDENGEPIFDGYTIIEKGGVKIGFFGLETPETQTKANPALIKGLTFLTETTATTIWQNAQAQVDTLKTAGADIIVCLSHLGVDPSSEPYRSYDLYSNVTGIDFIIDAHSHTVMTEGTNKEPIQSTGANLKNIGVIKINNTTKTIEDHYLVATGETGYNTKDETVAAKAQAIIDEIEAVYGTVFAKTEVVLDQTAGRVAEANIGDLITDAMLWYVTEKNTGLITGVSTENVVAITNGGGIRATLQVGDLTMNDIKTVLPFGNTATVVYVTGAELLEALEASTFCTPTSVGGFPQVSGIKFTIDTTKAYDANAETYPGSTYYGPASINRVTIQEINGKAFDANASYAVVSNNFCAAGGDTYYAFASASAQVETGYTLDAIVIDYITEKLGGTVTEAQYGKTQGRITILDGTEDETVEFEFLVTSDLHGKIFATDYSAGAAASGTFRQGLTRISTYIKEQRAIYGDNLYTVDMGDTIQGEPLTWYYAFNKPEEQPAIKALRTIGYDMWLLGNHEFNYGMNILDKEMNYATSASTETEKQLVIADANYLAAETNNAETKDWDCYGDIVPYVIQEFDGVKVAIIGLSTPNIPKWDGPENWRGFYFESIYTTYKHYEAEMLEQADMIVVMAHTGINSEMNDASYDSIRYLVEHTNTIDLVFSGHEHGKLVNDIANSDGEIVKVIQPSTKAALVGQAKVTYNKTTDEFTIEAANVNMANYAIDEDLVKVLQPYETYVWENYMSVKIGEAGDDFTASGLGTAPSAFVDLVNKVQLWGAYDQDGTNTPDDPTDDTPAQLSITAPLTSGSNANLIPKGDICLGDLFALYRYENWFYQLTMTGKEIRTWLEYSASKVIVNTDGTYDIAGGLTYYDVIGGEGFSYVIDPTKDEGSRIVSMTYYGTEIADDEEFTIVMNNYRFTGGGNYVKYCNEHGCDLSDLEDRIIYSTQYDMNQGEDKGQARALLQAYIEQEGIIYPEITSTWSIQSNYVTTDTTKTIEVFETTDIHGYLLDTSSGDENTFQYRLARIAQIIKEARANEEIDDVILLDSGDIYQGTPVSNLTYGNALRAAFDKMGYDAVSLGNHEFDWDVKTYATDKDGTMPAYKIGEYEGDSTIPVLAYDLIDNATGEKAEFVQEYTILDKAGLKVAVIGYIPDYSMDIMAAKINPYTIKDSLEDLNTKVEKVISTESPDVVIVLAHTSPKYVAEALNPAYVDLVCGGHSHQISYGRADSGVAYMQGNCQAKGYANTTITVDTATHTVTVETPTYVDITKDKTALYDTEENAALLDQEIVAISKASWNEVKSTMEEVLGEVDQSIYRRQTIGKSTNTIAGNWLTGIMLRATADQNTMIAFTNSGGIRCDLLKDEDALTRAITVGDIYTISPFGNRWYIYDLTGAELAQNVNNAFTNSNYGDQFSGMFVTYTKTTGADGRPVRTVKTITLDDGTPVDITNDTDRIYRIVTNEYCATLPGAVTENMTPVVDVNEAPVDNDAIIAVLRAEREANGGKITLDLSERCVEADVCADFTDIDTTKWYHEYVHYAITNGLMTGTNVPGIWGIKLEISRAEIVQVLYALEGKPETAYTGRFTDVAEGRWFTEAIEWAAANGIVAGTGTGTTFEPEMLVDRQQTVTILKAYATYKGYDTGATAELTDYVDRADAAGWAEPALKWAVAVGLLDSTSTTTKTLEPQTVSTREVFATILYKFVNTKFAGVATIYFTNDVHGAYENYARLATLIAGDRDLLLDAGDNVEGSQATTLTKGQCMIDVMNALHYDLATLGNHDFGLGFERFFSEEGTPYVSANFWDLQKDEAVLDAYKIFDVEGVKIAVVGVTTPETLTKSTPAFFQDEDGNWLYGFCNDTTGEKLYTVVQDAVDEARAEGADYVIALAHLGIDEQSEPWTSTSLIANTTGIDALIDGHSHSTFTYTKPNKDGEEVVVAQTGTKLEKVGKLTIGLESGAIKATLVEVTKDIEEDPEVKVVVDAITEEVAELINTVVATTEVDLTTKDPDTGKRAVRNAETNLGDLCADAYRDLLGTDIAFVNGGGVRADIAAGNITYGDIINVHPFGNKACVIEVTGQQILDALEHSVASTPGESGGFLQVSGITFTVDLSVESTVVKDETGMFVEVAGARRVKDVKVGGEPIDPDKTYTLGGHNYMLLQSGDGYSVFKGAKVIANEVALDNEVLIHYITETLGGKITADSIYANPRGAGRITILSAE